MIRRVSARAARAWAFDALIAAGVAALAGMSIFMRQTPSETVLLGYAMAVAVLFRRRHPMIVMAVISLAALAQVVFFPPAYDPLPYDLAVLVGMYSAVKYSRRIAGGYLAGAVVAIGIAIEVARHFNDDWPGLALFYVGVCGGVWLMAYTMRTRRLYVASLEERAATLEREREHLARIAVADERASIARELHDVVAHSLAVMIVQADGARYAIDADPERARLALQTVGDTGRDALEDMRRLVAVLRGDGVEEPAERRLGTLADLVRGAQAAGLSVTGDVVTGGELSPAVALSVYRIVQESLTNVMRHAGPSASVVLSVRHEQDRLTVSIVDDGGQPPRPAPVVGQADGHGLTGMRERINVHGGTLEAGPLHAGGWSVRACIPVMAKQAVTT